MDNCSAIEELLKGYIKQTLNIENIERVEMHLSSCDTCREKLKNLLEETSTDTTLGEEYTYKEESQPDKRFSLWDILMYSIVVLVILFAIGFLLFIFST